MKSLSLLFVLLASVFLNGCATLDRDYEKPKVDVVGITKEDSDTEALQFTIKLRIVNPNPDPIKIEGLYYELSLDGIDVVNGTAKNIPEIEGYSDTVVSVSSAANLINSVRLAAKLMDNTSDELPYQLRAKLGGKSGWFGSTTVKESGMIPLR